jgi:hypothetical protein
LANEVGEWARGENRLFLLRQIDEICLNAGIDKQGVTPISVRKLRIWGAVSDVAA